MAAATDPLKSVLDVIHTNEHFLVVSHTSPDGDAVGSTMAMGKILENAGKTVTYFNVDPIPYNFRFLDPSNRWVTEIEPTASFDVTIMLDCGEKHRIGEVPSNLWGSSVMVVDHHKTYDPTFADVYFRDVDAAATGELVFHIGQALGCIDEDVAKSLYTCLVTDTGSFRYSNTTKKTFEIAGELVGRGVNPWDVTSAIYESQPRERLTMLARVLSTLEYSPCGRLAFLRLDDQLQRMSSDPALIDGFINYARSVQGVEVATQMTENHSDGTWRISFRSRGRVDVSALAAHFGGGGHHNAAGCTLEGTAEFVQEKLTDALVALLDS